MTVHTATATAQELPIPMCSGKRSRDDVVIAAGYGMDAKAVGVRAPVVSIIFSTSLRPVLGPTQPLIRYRGYSGRSVKLTTHI
jgi:hypothetical protein